MRIAHVNPDPGIAPGRKKGAAIHVDAMREAFRALGVEVVEIDAGADTEVQRALERADASAPLELVYERHALERYAASEFARARGLPHVLEVNAPLAEEVELYRGGTLAAHPARERSVFAEALLVLAVSNDVARYAVARGSDLARVRVTPNAVDPKRFRPRAAGDPTRVRLVPDGRFVVGFHGRLRPWHNFALLVDALVLLLDEGHEIHLLILGEGPFDDYLGGRRSDMHATRIAWLPHEEAASVVACFDAVALSYAPDRPCYYSPLKLLEAMAVGAVPVVPRLGDLALEVEHETRGLVYEPGNARDLARSLGRLMREPELHARLAHGARAWAEEHTWEKIASQVLETALAGRSR